MTITTVNGVEVDTDSRMYQDYLRGLEADKKYGSIPEPAGFRTLGDVIELERRRRDYEARQAAGEVNREPTGAGREGVPA